jgi:hypothetical protein
MENPFEEMLKLMDLPLETSAKYFDMMEKGQKAMESMATAQKDMAEFQQAWNEFQNLNPLTKKS